MTYGKLPFAEQIKNSDEMIGAVRDPDRTHLTIDPIEDKHLYDVINVGPVLRYKK